jgi:hypothetical protein
MPFEEGSERFVLRGHREESIVPPEAGRTR